MNKFVDFLNESNKNVSSTSVSEGAMDEIHSDIETLMAKGLKEFKKTGGAEALWDDIRTQAKKLAKTYKIKEETAIQFINDYVESEID